MNANVEHHLAGFLHRDAARLYEHMIEYHKRSEEEMVSAEKGFTGSFKSPDGGWLAFHRRLHRKEVSA